MFNNNSFWTWFNPSAWMTGWNVNQSLNKPTKQQKFPWLNAEQIKRLESLTSDPQEQQKLYQQAIELQQSRNMQENRIAAENELQYKSLNTKDTQQKNYMQSNVRLEQLADLTKKKFWLNADADTQGVINWLMQYAQDKGVSMDSLNDYLAWYNDRFLYDTWLKEESTAHKIWQVATDIVWWAYDSVTWLPKFFAKWAANAIGWVAKQFWADEAKTDELVQSYKDYLDNEMSSKDIGADQESLTYNISKGVWDVTQVFAWEWLIKAWVQSTVKGWQLLNSLKNAPTWQKMAAWWLEWVWDMTLYSIVSESRLPTKEELALWWGIGTVIPWAWAVYKAAKPIIKKWTQKVAAKLELSGMLNPAKLNAIKNQLVEEWADLASAWLKWGTAEDVGTWMIERWFKGDKPTIINDLWEYAQKSHKLKREVLGASETLHNVDSAKKSLKAIYDTISDVPWLENKVKRVEELMAKEQHTLSELDEIKSILDDTVSIYTNAGDVKAWAVKKWLDAVRKDLRKYIEDAASKEWLGNIKMLNNETQVAKWLQDAISRKDSADAARELLSVFDKWTIGWALAWGTAWWPFDSDSVTWKIWNIIVWALAWKYLFSTKTKTQLASLLNKLSGGSKKELERLIAGDLSLKKLSNKTQKELGNVFEELKLTETKPTEMTEAEYQALLKKYSNSDLPALEFKEWVDDAWKNILAWDSEKIIATPEWVNIREWQIWELPTKNVNYASDEAKIYKDSIPEDKITLTPKQIDKISKWELDSEWANQLVALHNLSLDNLKKTADLWGLPMPSVAVTRRWVPHESYWDISLVLKKEAIDPATNKANKLFSVDAYTATVPQPKYLPKGWKEAKEIISNIQKETGLSYWEVNQWIEFPAEYERMYPELKKYSDLHDKVADKKLFEWYTNAGSRRYKDYTLDNVVKNMKKDDGRTAFWNFGKLVWDERWKLKWLSDARNIEYKATDTESYWKLANEYNDAKRDVYNSITDEDSFLDFDVFNDIVESSFNKNDKKRLENINKELNGDFWYELSLDDVQKIHKPIQDWAKIQRPYAEAKPERPVKFDEVSYVLAPEEQAAEVEKLLWDKVQVVSYKASEWRASKLEELQKKYGNVFFWLWWSIFPISYLLGSNWDKEQSNTIEA